MEKYENKYTSRLLKLVASGRYQRGRKAKMRRDCEILLIHQVNKENKDRESMQIKEIQGINT